MSIVLFVLAAILVIAGIAGLMLPAFPGAPLLLGGLLIAAWAEDFHYIGSITIGVLCVLAVLTYVVDFIASAFGVKRFGASPRAMIGAGCGAVIGLFFGLPGVIFGPFIGAVLGELSVRPDIRSAGRAGIGATLGIVLGVAAKLSLAFVMLGVFLFSRFM